jgi:TrmH family RNA methyltransferase
LEEGLFVIEGPTLIAEAISAGWEIEEIFTNDKGIAFPGTDADVFALARGVLERVADTQSPQPALAIAKRTLRTWSPSSSDWVVWCESVSDPGNLGTILRSAEAFGASAVMLSEGSVDPTNPKVVRSSAGAVFHLAIVEGASLDDVREKGYRIVGTSSHDEGRSVSLDDADLSGKVCLAMGNEARGLEESFDADVWVTIPHRGRSESLNVAMAATIMCFATANQHSSDTHNE